MERTETSRVRTRAAAAVLIAAGMLAAARVAGAGDLTIDDFEDGDLVARPGLGWIAIADDLAGGASSGELATVRGAEGSAGALRLTGTVREGFSRPFAGAWVAVAGDGRPRDLSGFSGLRFRVRGAPGSWVAGVRRAGPRPANFMAPIEVTPEWTLVELPFARLVAQAPAGAEPPAWSPVDVAWLGVSSAGAPGAVAIELDDVELVAAAPPGSATRRVGLTDAAPLAGLAWRTLAEEPAGDGASPRLPDATALSWAWDRQADRVWFRAALAAPPPAGFLGINVALDGDGDPGNGMAWWGRNAGFRFDRLITAYLTRSGGDWQGWAGVADAAQVAAGTFDGLGSAVAVAVDRERPAFLVGVPRALVDGDGRLRLIATVGSSMMANDDLPDEGAVELALGE